MRSRSFTRLALIVLLLAGLSLTFGGRAVVPTPAAASTGGGTTTTTTGTVSLCGPITGYTPATAFSSGSIIIGGVPYTIDAGGVLTNANLIAAGVNLCIQAVFDGSNNIAYGTVVVNSGPAVSICGVVTSYTPASALGFGLITINNATYTIAPGVILTGTGLFSTGFTQTVCLQGSLNTAGQIASGSIVLGGSGGNFRLCGLISAIVYPTFISPGSITIGGRNVAIAAGAAIVNLGAAGSGNDICLVGTLNTAGQIASGAVTADAAVSFVVCGVVQGFTAPANGAPGTIRINNQTTVVEANAVVTGAILVSVGSSICINGTLDGTNRLSVVGFSLANGGTVSTTVCGVITSYTAATSISNGTLVIGGATYAIASANALTGFGLLASGANVCLQVTLNSSGQIATGTVTSNGGVQVSVCGLISSYTAATNTVAGLVTIAGITFPVAAGAGAGGVTTISASSTLGVTLSLNGQGQVTALNVTATSCNITTISGPITGFVAATATTTGSITIGGLTFSVAVGTVLSLGGVPLAATPYEAGGRIHRGREYPD